VSGGSNRADASAPASKRAKLGAHAPGQKSGRRLLLLPTVLLLLVFSIFPLVASVALGFGSWDIGMENPYSFRGLANFARLVGDSRYFTSLVNTLVYAGGSVALQFGIGLALAWMLYQRPPGHSFYRVLFLMPMMLTPVAVAYMWRLIFEHRIGAINFFLSTFGLEPIPWLTERATALLAIVVVETWQWTPFVFVFMYAALENLPRDVIDAAVVDGASRWQTFRHVVFPLLRPIAIAILLLRMVESLKIMDTVYVMTGGGPGNSTESLTLYAYRAGLQFFDLGSAAAIALTLLVGVLILALPLVLRLTKEAETV
jgi:multiple sugar transport system permease protein